MENKTMNKIKTFGESTIVGLSLSFGVIMLITIIGYMISECSLSWRYWVLLLFASASIYTSILLNKLLPKASIITKKPTYCRYNINMKKIRVSFKSVDGDIMERTLESFLHTNKETKEYYSFISADELLRTLTTGTKSMIFEIDGWRKASTIQSWKIEEAIDDFKVYELIEINEDHLRRYDNFEFITLLEEENEENKDENKNN